jgi:hypothetical protein
MKLIQTTSILVLALAASAHGQVLLNTGDVFTYQFTSLPAAVTASFPVQAPAGGFSFSLSSFDASGDVLFVEMFENSTNESPVETFVTEALTDGTAIYGAWADFQGVVRFTMLAGSVTLESITFFHEVPLDAESRQLRQVTVVPVRGSGLVELRVPCTGPRPGRRWKNHGEYVSAVRKAVKQLLIEGGISKLEAEDILEAAARSNCGKK